MYFMLGAIYQPQNIYCITVDGTSSLVFQKTMSLLADCFQNIFVIVSFKLKLELTFLLLRYFIANTSIKSIFVPKNKINF